MLEIQKNLKNYQLILGSGSPRRSELLHGLDVPFKTLKIDTEENYPSPLKAAEITDFLCRKKANAFSLASDEILLTSDTIVWLEGEAIGKPKDEKDAVTILKKLSGKMHEVITSVCIRTDSYEKVVNCITKVFFKELEDEEIRYYISHYKPFDKAGAYGIQQWIGFTAVERIEGSYFNVMGFPVHLVYKLLQEIELK